MASIDFFENSSLASWTSDHRRKFEDQTFYASQCGDDNGTSNNSCGGLIPFCKQMLLEEIGGHRYGEDNFFVKVGQKAGIFI